ncbi:MAG: hypothetical protein LUG14_04805 [Synergistaceae bacterium]|nr:hypothetical protein [Synergistaceae bacterium]
MLTVLFAVVITSQYLADGGCGPLISLSFRYGYPIFAAFAMAAAASPLSLTLLLWLSLRHRRGSADKGPLYRNLPLVLCIFTQGLLLAALLFFLVSNIF